MLIYIPSFLFKTSGLFTTVFPEDSTQTEWLLSPFKTNVQYALISTSELGVQYLHSAIFLLLFLTYFFNFETKQLFIVLRFPCMPSFILSLLAGLGGFMALSVEHTARAGELSQGEERKR